MKLKELKHEVDVYVGEGCGERDVVIDCEKKLDEMMAFYMGDNTTQRRDFILGNLK